MTTPTLIAVTATVIGLAACGQGSASVPLPGPAVPRPAAQAAEPPPRFRFAEPAQVVRLPAALREISAITAFDAQRLLAVQDEAGKLFEIDLAEAAVRVAVHFGGQGDYEGLARAGLEFFVLRSDRTVFPLTQRDGQWSAGATFRLDVPHDEVEGLAFDPDRNQLLFAPKDLPDGGRKAKEKRPIFAFDLAARRCLAAPRCELDLDDVVEQAAKLGVDLPQRVTDKGKSRPAPKLRVADLAVAADGSIWLLSAVDHLLVVIGVDGQLRGLHRLDAVRLPQPEGLAFLPDGRLAIASEGAGGPAVVEVYAPLGGERSVVK
jgi:uncharacterized protein YjiK